MPRPYDPYNPHANLTDTESEIEGDLSFGLDLITRILPAPVSYEHFQQNLIAGIHYLTRAAESMGYDMSAPFPDQDKRADKPEWELREVWQVVYRYHTEPEPESCLGELLTALRDDRRRRKEEQDEKPPWSSDQP